MREGRPSATAQANAAFRAAEWIYPQNQQVCSDQFARCFLGTRFKLIIWSRVLTRIAIWYADRIIPNAQSSVVVRHRYMDDYLMACIDAGIQQVVILGAGYDSRAYRFPGLAGKVRVYEVDHPDTLRDKMQKVKRLLGSLPDHVVYVPIDLDSTKLGVGLFGKGYSRHLKTLFIWEGVTVYLTDQGIDETLSFISNNSGVGSSVVFDYAYQSAFRGTLHPEEARKWRASFERRGEAPKFGVDESDLGDFLTKRGFSDVHSVSMESLGNEYFGSKGIKRKVTRLGGIVHANVASSGGTVRKTAPDPPK